MRINDIGHSMPGGQKAKAAGATAGLAALLLLAAAALPWQVRAAEPPVVVARAHGASRHAGDSVTSGDWHFMQQASAVLHGQMSAGKLAAANAADPAVRDLGKRLLRESRTTSRHLGLLALGTQVFLPSRASKPVDRQLARLKALHGEAFDRAFLAQFAVAVQRDAVSLFEEEARSTDRDARVRKFARRMLPPMQASLQQGRQLQQQDAARHGA